MAEDVKIFDGTNWKSLKGADGAEGPTVVSADAGNVAKLGTDGKLLVNPADLDPRFVNLTGDTMTGPLTAPSMTVNGNITSSGTAHNFAQGSIPSTAWGPMVLLTEATTTGSIDRTDAGKILVAAPPINQDFTMTLPTAGTAGIVSGMVVELVSNITSAGKYYIIQAPAGVSLFYNSTLGGSGEGTLGGGVAAKCRLRGPMTSIRLLCVDSSTWWAFGDLVPL